VALVSAGSVQTSYGYDPYGVSQVTGTASDNPFQFTGREYDNTSLLNYRYRYYNPAWGRFVSEDPLEFEGGDVNFYRYVANNPAQFNDPSGLYAYTGNPDAGPTPTPSAQPTPPIKMAGGKSPIVRCPGVGGIKCGAPTAAGGVNDNYPNVCPNCLSRIKAWPYNK
jgi:RHS repeat-associated protein